MSVFSAVKGAVSRLLPIQRVEVTQQIEIRLMDMQILSLQPTDTIIFRTPRSVSDENFAMMAEKFKEKFPGHRAMFLDGGMEISVLRDDTTDGTD